ncbi:divalent metal cation transporter [Streptomyces sp. NPDC048405]|uniref:divalent metal cation transporter n=1 Tax=Streptomyces TaxID=1883 RepID=UPI001E3AC35B|nr:MULTISPECIES: divalent metal cation transporter [Streptomyces]WSU02483.1 divalent metal cation transporter [Streptomyces sp. NBC_01124]
MTYQDHREHRDQQEYRGDQEHRGRQEHRGHPDPYRLGTPRAASAPGDGPGAVSRGDVLRTLLWAVVVLSAVANMALSFAGAATPLHLATGVVTVLAAGTLVVRALRGRR